MQGNVVGGGSSGQRHDLRSRLQRTDYDRLEHASGPMRRWGWLVMGRHASPTSASRRATSSWRNAAHSGDGPLKVSDRPYISEAATSSSGRCTKTESPVHRRFHGRSAARRGVRTIERPFERKTPAALAELVLETGVGDDGLTLVTEARANRVLLRRQRAIGDSNYVKRRGKVIRRRRRMKSRLTAGAFRHRPSS